jgi:hypothetical protein
MPHSTPDRPIRQTSCPDAPLRPTGGATRVFDLPRLDLNEAFEEAENNYDQELMSPPFIERSSAGFGFNLFGPTGSPALPNNGIHHENLSDNLSDLSLEGTSRHSLEF